uniref:Fibronectin type-III domain-containing protein n=1 Tax=Timema douglasi TaxID=61478 RepID=A0A7R8VAL6_TIMDO|nr:unnamed protein product [Timema douglasi]
MHVHHELKTTPTQYVAEKGIINSLATMLNKSFRLPIPRIPVHVLECYYLMLKYCYFWPALKGDYRALLIFKCYYHALMCYYHAIQCYYHLLKCYYHTLNCGCGSSRKRYSIHQCRYRLVSQIKIKLRMREACDSNHSRSRLGQLGKPDPLHNCTFLNQTAESLHVDCSEGFDGGLPQEFVMEVYDAVTQTLVSNVTSRTPLFTVNGLESGLEFDISLYASNAKGRSEVLPLHAYTLKAAEKRTGWPGRPQPPAKCSITRQTTSSLTVSCLAPLFMGHISSAGTAASLHDVPPTFVLQAYDAETRRLVASATSQSPGNLQITDLPAEHRALVLSVRTVTAHATSDAISIYTRTSEPQEQLSSAATPTILHITPLLGALIGVVVFLVLVAAIIVLVMRRRGRGGGDEKERDGGGRNGSGAGRRGMAGDKSSTVPLSKDTDESMDEKNPDIIPQNSDTDYQDPDEKAFEKLNNAPNRYGKMVPRLQSPNIGMYENSNNVMNIPKPVGEVEYAELSLPRPHVGGLYASPVPQQHGPSTLPPPVRRGHEPTVYAQIDVTKRGPLPAAAHSSDCSPLPLLHTHHLTGYQQPLPLMLNSPPPASAHEPPVDVETPLISPQQHRENTYVGDLISDARVGTNQFVPRTASNHNEVLTKSSSFTTLDP